MGKNTRVPAHIKDFSRYCIYFEWLTTLFSKSLFPLLPRYKPVSAPRNHFAWFSNCRLRHVLELDSLYQVPVDTLADLKLYKLVISKLLRIDRLNESRRFSRLGETTDYQVLVIHTTLDADVSRSYLRSSKDWLAGTRGAVEIGSLECGGRGGCCGEGSSPGKGAGGLLPLTFFGSLLYKTHIQHLLPAIYSNMFITSATSYI